MHIFYEPDLKHNGNILNEEESYHCIKVLRHKISDLIYVLDGNGRKFICKIIDPSPKQCKLAIQQEETSLLPESKCHIAVSPIKSQERFEWFIEKSCEIGIKEITPILCKQSERKAIKPERLEKIITSALKQSVTLWRPKLNPLTYFNDFLTAKNDFSGQKFIATCLENNRKELKKEYKKNNNVTILIGPEGDFDIEEINSAVSNGYDIISLSKSRLRTETAALVACNIIQIIND